MSSEIIESTLLALPTRWVRKFVSVQCEAKLFASFARWLAGRACIPAESGQINIKCSESPLRFADISVLDLSEDAFRVLEGLLQWNLNHANAIEAFSPLDLDVNRKNCNMCLADIALREFVLNSH